MAAEEKKPVEAPKAEVKPVNVEAVFGDIVHPFTETRFVIGSKKQHVLDSWVEIQRDAGKIVVTE